MQKYYYPPSWLVRNPLVNSICLSFTALTLTLTGCGWPTPKELAEEPCDCWQEMNALQNSTAKANKADECYQITQNALYNLRRMGVAKNWTDEQVRQAEREFDSAYDACSRQQGNSNSSNVEATSADSTSAVIEAGPQRPQAITPDPVPAKTLAPNGPALNSIDDTEPTSTSDAIAPGKHTLNLFKEDGRETHFDGKVGKLPAYFRLVLQEDMSINGTYMYNKRKVVYRLQGTLNEDGTVDLTEFTGENITAHCKLLLENGCYVGKMNNTDGRSFNMSMCGAD